MDQVFQASGHDVRALHRQAVWHAHWAVRLGILGLLLLAPLALERAAAPAVSVAAIFVVLASGDALDGRHRRAHQRFAGALLLGVVAHFAWVPRMIEQGEPDRLLFVTLVGFVVLTIGSMATVWADQEAALAMRTEHEREQARRQLQMMREIGRTHGIPGPLRREEIERLAAENDGTGGPQSTPWRGTPAHVNIRDARHPNGLPKAP